MPLQSPACPCKHDPGSSSYPPLPPKPVTSALGNTPRPHSEAGISRLGAQVSSSRFPGGGSLMSTCALCSPEKMMLHLSSVLLLPGLPSGRRRVRPPLCVYELCRRTGCEPCSTLPDGQPHLSADSSQPRARTRRCPRTARNKTGEATGVSPRASSPEPAMPLLTWERPRTGTAKNSWG